MLNPFKDQFHKVVAFVVAKFKYILGVCGREDIILDHVPRPEQSYFYIADGQIKTFRYLRNLHAFHLPKDKDDLILLGEGIDRLFYKGSRLFVNGIVFWVHD